MANNYTWIEQVDDLSPAALTVRAQALPADDMGMLYWSTFFPRADVDSTRLQDILAQDLRYVADRREWDAFGRLIPVNPATTRLIDMIPIEAYDRIGEKEMQRLREETRNNQATIMDVVGARIPARTDKLAMACYRRLELDCVSAWTKGFITQVDPQTGRTFVTSYGLDAARLQTAGTAWSDGSVNAYNLFIAWLEAAQDAVGELAGVAARRSTIATILADAPNLPNSVSMNRSQLSERISQDIGADFNFFYYETSVDNFTDGGTAVTRAKVFPDRYIAAIPAGAAVGQAAFAPVARAMDIDADVPEAGIDMNGVTIYHESQNTGKELVLNAQLNAMPVPNEQLVYTINIGA